MSYGVHFTNSGEVITAFRKLSQQIAEDLTAMEKQVEATLADWDGPAREQYWIAKAEWNQAAARMPAHLGTAQVTLANIMDGYAGAESSSQKMWSS